MRKREYVDGNGGNMAVRIGADMAICTPTMVSKGSNQPRQFPRLPSRI
jgi:L-fuculose-phosphate aldolase